MVPSTDQCPSYAGWGGGQELVRKDRGKKKRRGQDIWETDGSCGHGLKVT